MTDQLDTAAIRAQMEALTDFTPGPWCSSNQPGDWGLAGTNHIHVAGANPYQCDQCITHVEYQTPYCLGEKRSVIEAADQAAANARLIAAAPEMRETILTLCAYVERLRAENERLCYVLDGVAGAIDTGRNEPLQIWRDQINIARAALGQEGDA